MCLITEVPHNKHFMMDKPVSSLKTYSGIFPFLPFCHWGLHSPHQCLPEIEYRKLKFVNLVFALTVVLHQRTISLESPANHIFDIDL